MKTIEALKIYNSIGKYLVHIPAYRGEELFLYQGQRTANTLPGPV